MDLFKRFISSILLIPFVIFAIFKGSLYFNFLLLIVFFLGLFEIVKLKDFKIKIPIFIIFLFFLFFSYKIMKLKDGSILFFGLILISWLSDIGGYIFGKLFGGKKISFISPNKTFSGFLGSIFLSQFAMLYYNFIDYHLFNNLYKNFIFLFFCSLCVILGDLFFSYCKRLTKIKDYSNIIPGHGGLFDRIDGLVFLIIFYYIFFII